MKAARYKSTGMVMGNGDPTRQRRGQCLHCGISFYPCGAERARWYARKPIYFCTRRCAAAWAVKEAERQMSSPPARISENRTEDYPS